VLRIRITKIFSWLLLLILMGQWPFNLPSSAQRATTAPFMDAGAVRVAYVYVNDAATGEDFDVILAGAGYDLTFVKLPVPPESILYLPILIGAGGLHSQAFSAPLSIGEQGLRGYDLYIIADDTAGHWSDFPNIADAIKASGKPVVAVGQGGLEFLAALHLLPPGQSAEAMGERLFVRERSESRLFYTHPNNVLPEGDSVQVLLRAGPVVTYALPDRPQLIRAGSLTADASSFALLQVAERFVFWGFRQGPEFMTSEGSDIFLNALWFQAGKMALPIAGTGAVPVAGFDESFLLRLHVGGQALHALVQLDHIPDSTERDRLEENGVQLQTYLSGTFYHALVMPDFDAGNAFNQAMIRWMAAISPSLKVDPELDGDLTAMREADIDTAVVIFHDDVASSEAMEILSQYTDAFQYFADHMWEIPLDASLIDRLLTEEAVRWITAGPPPPLETNDGGRARTGTDAVQCAVMPVSGAPTYLGLTGRGVLLAQFEDKPDVSHIDFGGRISLGGKASSYTSSHATHVAGIMLGDGTDSLNHGGSNRQWRGHAPAATLVTEGTDSVDGFFDAFNTFGAEVSNHSYVMESGRYGSASVKVDSVVRGNATDSHHHAILPRLAVWAAANQGVSAQYNNEAGFYSIYSPAKNSISVGSIDSNDGQLSMFSSKGPTFDGRIKPDVMAPGCQNGGDGGITSTKDGGGYTVKCGTSMATPATVGVTALMLEQYHQLYGATSMPRPATLKALLINTATDLVHTASDSSDKNDPDLCRAQGPNGTPVGPNDPLDPDCWIPYGPGPDFATGYGAVNAMAAVNAVRGKMFLEDSLSPTDTQDDFTITVAPGRSELRVTLAWDDEPGDASLGATVNQLVNDLDLRLIGPDGTHFPFTLDPLPSAHNLGGGASDPIDQSDIVDARRDDDDRNNVEQVLVQNPVAGTWTIRVSIEGNFPTNRAQPYSLAGDFRSFHIVQPTTGEAVDAGEKNDPATFLIILEAEQAHASGAPNHASTFRDALASDFTVSIDGAQADIISGAPVGDQFWLTVRPLSGVYDPNYYDLTVTWTGYGSDTQTDSVYFLKRRTADRVIVVDHSGSMADYDKMRAAQDAGRMFLDQAMEDDRVAVVAFSTSAASPYPIHVVSSGNSPPELAMAKSAINALIPTNATAIGKGLLRGKSEIDAPGGNSEIRRMVLLSDGMENVAPLYNTSTVKGVIQPTDIIVDTVAVGPEGAGHHALLTQIARDNGGQDYHVTESGFGGTLFSAASARGGSYSEWVLPGELENRLAEQYKLIAEDIRREQRLWQVSGQASSEQEGIDFDVRVDEELATINFTINWANANARLGLTLRDSQGRVYAAGDPDVVYRSDATHETWIIRRPSPGFWGVRILHKNREPVEFVAWLSAHTRVRLHLYLATPPEDRAAGAPVHILALLEDGKPIVGADVVATIVGPDDRTWQFGLPLYDDGRHNDGEKDDGLYGNWYLNGSLPGNYALRIRAEGKSNLGEPFLRYANRTFFMRPRALFVYENKAKTARSFEKLLEEHSWSVDVRRVEEVAAMDVSPYSLYIIGEDTGRGTEWGNDGALERLMSGDKPVLGLNEGGYAYFGKLGLNIGVPYGAHGSGKQIDWNHPDASIWRYPYDLHPLPKGPLTLYASTVPTVDIYTDHEESVRLQVYGWRTADPRYANLITEKGRYTLWGFASSPDAMTETGRQLFVNTASFTAFGAQP